MTRLRMAFGLVGAFFEVAAELLGLDQDVVLAAEFGNEDVLFVADAGGLDVLVAAASFCDGVDVHAALVGEGGAADERRAGEVRVVGNIVHEIGEIAQLFEMRDHREAHLELEDGDDGGEVAVSGAFAVAVDGALDLGGAGFDGGDGVGDGEFAIVVGVDAEGSVGDARFHRRCRSA